MVLPHLSKHLKHTRKALVNLRATGDVRGWFGLVQKGRPKQSTATIKLSRNPGSNPGNDASTVSDLTATTAPAEDDDGPPGLYPRHTHIPLSSSNSAQDELGKH